MSIDKMREEFEFAIRNNGFFHDATEAAKDAYLERGSNGQYRSLQVNGAWWGWQASRESLVIELPPLANTGVDTGGWPIDSRSHRVNSVISKCREAIQSAGVKTK